MLKRSTDLFFSGVGLMIFSPIIVTFVLLVWLQDFHNPFYVAKRAGLKKVPFNMIKLRSMRVNADKTGVTSTSNSDNRITKVGQLIRKFKLDELTQLINVFKGEMSLVGPRPQVIDHIEKCYTDEELILLTVKPGITDISSIVFSDEGDILANSLDPDLNYNQLIRPWKSRLGILYINNKTLALDLKLLILTVIAIVSKEKALFYIQNILDYLKADRQLIDVCKRKGELFPYPPPGSNEIVTSRSIK